MTDHEIYKACLITFCEALRDIVDKAKRKKNKKTDEFDVGYLCCLHRIVTLIHQQAEIYDIPLTELSLNDLKDTDLM